jgi:choline-sulfatase
MTGRKTNLLFLIADDHAGYVLGAHGNRQAATPNLDRLARQSTRFAANHCNSPVCTPSRQSILTGLYPHAAGVTTLQTPLAESKTTLADILTADGYQTAVFGKMHFNRPGEDGMHGFATAMTEDRINRGWQQAVGRPRPPWRPFRDPARTWLNAEARALPFREEEMRSAWQWDQARRWLDSHHNQGPFALWFSIQEPHSPFDFPSEDAARFAPSRFPVPAVGPEDAWQIPLIFRDLSPADKQGIISAYYTSAHYLDRTVGKVLTHLDSLGHAEDTLVVYMADHGYCLGHHGRFEKHCFYQPALHVPLMMRLPGQLPAGKVIRHRTESVDVSPTITRLLKLSNRLPSPHGRDLLTSPPKDEIFSVYLENEEACLIWENWKFIYSTGRRKRLDGYETDQPTPGPITRLYDLKRDPGEFRNVAAQYPALVQNLRHRLEARFAATHPEPGLDLDAWLRPRDAK